MSALRFTSLNQLARLAGGPAILILLPLFLSVEQQGYWFVMISLTAFVAFADMGLSTALIQSAAHEHAKCDQFNLQSNIDATHYKFRLETLRLFAWRRSASVALWVLPCVLGLGFYILNGQNTTKTIHWVLPWILYCITSVASLVLTIILAYYEGCNDVARIQRARAAIALINVGLLALGLVFGLNLWALPLATGVSTAAGFGYIAKERRSTIAVCLTQSLSEVDAGIRAWSKEISPLLARYAASWIGGYAMFQLFTPIVFRLEGAAAAGQVGLTIAVFTAIFTLSNVWSTYQLPRFAMAVALRDRDALNNCLAVALKGSLLTYGVLLCMAGIAYLILYHFTHLLDRFLGIEAMATLALIWLLQLLVHNFAVYLRAFKEEPLVWHTLIAAVQTIVATLLTLQLLGLDHIFSGFLTVYFWFAPAVFLLFIRKRELTKHWPRLAN